MVNPIRSGEDLSTEEVIAALSQAIADYQAGDEENPRPEISEEGSSFINSEWVNAIASSHCLWTNPLSFLWIPSIRERSSVKVFLPLAYVGGMVGYSLALLTRIMTVVSRFFGFVPALLHAISSKRLFPLKEQFAHLNESIVYAATAVVGVICPPLGYYLDAKVLGFSIRYFPQFFYGRSFYTPQGWGVSTDRGFITHNFEDRISGVAEMRERVNARLKNEKERFVEAFNVAKQYGIDVDDLSPETMAAITELAGILIGEKQEEGFADYIIVKGEYDTKEKEELLKECIRQMHTLWETLVSQFGKERVLSCLAKQIASENGLECSSKENLSTLPPTFTDLVNQAKVFYHICEGQCRLAWTTLYQSASQDYS